MNTELINLRLAVSNAVNAQEKAKRDYESKLLELNKWKQKYKAALEKGRDDLASAAKFQVERFLVLSKSVKSAIDQQEPYIERLKIQLLSLEENDSTDLSEKRIAKEAQNTNEIDEVILGILEPPKTDKTLATANSNFEIAIDELKTQLDALDSTDITDELNQLKAHLSVSDIDVKDTKELSLVNQISPNNSSPSRDFLLLQLIEIICDVEKAISNTPNYKEYLQIQYKLTQEKVNQYHNEAKDSLQRDSGFETVEALINQQVHKKLALVLKEQLEQQSMRIDVMKRILVKLRGLEENLQNNL